ncbi:MAG: hypothetical protein QCI38_03035, partial [Candidatus Thermoplasmatota archaeon]|nr:hypothetical protein [Candidatus Thermoplasmatota archaeon]
MPPPQKPSKGKCGGCSSSDLVFYDDGSGMCNECGHVFWWDKSMNPEGKNGEASMPPGGAMDDETPGSTKRVTPPPHIHPQQEASLQQPPAPGYPQPPPLSTLPPGYVPPPPPMFIPQTLEQMDPATRKAWKKMKKKFKGGKVHGILGAVSAGIVYIAMPLLVLFFMNNLIPPDVDREQFPYFMRLFMAKLYAIPLLLGWLMVLAGFLNGYFRKGSPQKMAAAIGYKAGKGLYLFALMAPFAIAVDMGEAGFDISYLNYAYIIYILLFIGMLYDAAEYFVLRKDLAAYMRGEIPPEYYPKGQRPRPMAIPPPPPPP